MRFDRHFIKTVIPEVVYEGAELPEVITCSIDSRTINQGDLFIALVGAKVDGHDFIVEAVRKGAAAVIMSIARTEVMSRLSEKERAGCAFVLVSETYTALVALAHAWRGQFSYPVVGITGSVGKTSTKEWLAAMLRASGKQCLASQGTQNTVIGCALNILAMTPQHDVALFEMGISKRGEMAEMAALVRPTLALITTIGHSHMEGLGTLVDIATEKRQIFAGFSPENVGIIPGDVAVLSPISYHHQIVRFGTKMTNQVQARKIHVDDKGLSFVLRLYRTDYPVMLPTQHKGALLNGLAAATAAHVLGVTSAAIVQVLQQGTHVAGRFEQLPLKLVPGTVIHDCYNASPESMKAALVAFETLSGGPKIAVLGDMLELGVAAPFWHRQLGRFLRKAPSVTRVILVGEQVKWAQKTLPAFVRYEVVANWQEAAERLKETLTPESLVLVKGSLGMGLKNLVSAIAECS